MLAALICRDYLASWHFYRHEYESALALYQRLESVREAPLRANAAYMTLRCLNYLGRTDSAYEKAGKMLIDPSFKSVHAITGNYRFIIMNITNHFSTGISPELASRHLSWLIGLTQVSPIKSVDLHQALTDYFDALEQLDNYFPLYAPDSKSVDWWLIESETEWLSPRMQAVKKLAAQNAIVDWLQAQWAYNVFSHDWLWALHNKDAAYWIQNHHIVEHAWQHWLHGHDKDGAWLQIAINRVHPHDELAEAIIQAAIPYLTHNWRGETREYREWLFELWENLLRIQLGRENYPQVLALINDYSAFRELLSDNNSYQRHQHAGSLEKALRWLVYKGNTTEARAVLAATIKQYPNFFQHWRTLLASNWQEALALAQRNDSRNYYYPLIGNNVGLWQEITNVLPAKELFNLAANPKTNEEDKSYLARTALTRAFLLGFTDDIIDQYAVLAAKLNPTIRESLLQSVSRHQPNDYIDFMLRMPRFRPQTFTDISTSEKDLVAIDIYNHKDNNWWCRFNQQTQEQRIFDAAKITPKENDIFQWHIDIMNDELAPYLEQQKTLLTKHPYHTLVDQHELDLLAAIPDAPQYLSEAIVARELELPVAWNFWYPNEVRNKHAANLHQVVRITRYSCEGDSIGSKRAFKILHRQYANTIWAKATPYWFPHRIPKAHLHRAFVKGRSANRIVRDYTLSNKSAPILFETSVTIQPPCPAIIIPTLCMGIPEYHSNGTRR